MKLTFSVESGGPCFTPVTRAVSGNVLEDVLEDALFSDTGHLQTHGCTQAQCIWQELLFHRSDEHLKSKDVELGDVSALPYSAKDSEQKVVRDAGPDWHQINFTKTYENGYEF